MLLKKKKIGASDFLALGLYSFAGFGLEILLLLVEPLLFGSQLSQNAHWIITCILWGSICFLLIQLSKHKYEFDVMSQKEKPTANQWLFGILMSIFCILVTTIAVGGFKPVEEAVKKTTSELVLQNVYYLFESALILLTIVFGQKFGERLLKKTWVPYGGLFLACTWGLMHILVQDVFTGVYTIVMAIFYGIIYLLLKKNLYYSYLLITIAFVL